MTARRSTAPRRLLVVAGMLAASLAACGDSEPDASTSTDSAATTEAGETSEVETSEVETSEPGTTTATSGGDCGSTDVTFENLEAGTSFVPTATAAISYAGGSAFTIYLGDFPIDHNELSMSSVPEPSAGQNMVTVAITTFNAEGEPALPEVGVPITHDMADFGVLTFVVMANEGENMLGNNTNGEGTLTITSLGDTMCFDIEYADEEKSISGSVSAPVKTV